MKLPTDLMKEDMKKLFFVNFDRYIFNDMDGEVNLFGWIKRDDNKHDFVLLRYDWSGGSNWNLCYSTSSKEYSKTIGERLGCGHLNCTRVEDSFKDIDNCIRLNRTTDLKTGVF